MTRARRLDIRIAACGRSPQADRAAGDHKRQRGLAGEHRRQQGLAVIAALLVVAAAAAIAVTMLHGQNERAQLLQSEKTLVQARWLLLGSTEWARESLLDGARRSAIASMDQPWAAPVVDQRITLEGQSDIALLSRRIDDEQGKYNLENLASDGQIDPRQLAAFERLLQALDLPTSAAPDIARRIAAAEPLSTGDGANHAGAASSNGQTLPARAPGLQSLADLRGMGGLDDQAIQRLRCCVTLLPEQTAVNVNTAPPEVLYAVIERLPLGQAVALTTARDRGRYFNDATDFVNRLANPEIKLDRDSVSTNSEWFGLKGAVRLGQATVAMRALLQRDEDKSVSIVWMKETH
jgi:general secretion pathway protein K